MDYGAEQRSHLAAALGPAFRRGQRAAIFDFPFYLNPGDSAIWLGTARWLSDHGVAVHSVHRRESLERGMWPELDRDVVVVFMGGGNFGDLYPEHQALRIAALSRYPENPVVHFPQTLNYHDPSQSGEISAALSGRPSVTMAWRDRPSLAAAERLLPGPTHVLSPDAACGFPGWVRSREARDDFVSVRRTDAEASPDEAVRSFGRTVDWDIGLVRKVEWKGLSALHALLDGVGRVASAPARALRTSMYAELTRVNLDAALDTLSSGRVVVTDRLHGHILCALMRVPHIALPDRYGKVQHYYETWSQDDPLSVFLHHASRLEAEASRLLEQARASAKG